jgi:tRNA modification GTPase
MFDQSEHLRDEDFEVVEKIKNKNVIIVLNKCDLPVAIDENSLSSCIMNPASCILNISATRGDGIEELKDIIFKSCLKNWNENREGVLVTNLRHKSAIQSASGSINRAVQTLTENQPIEFIALEIRDSLDRLGEIVGAVTSEDILNRIFSEFCIGK